MAQTSAIGPDAMAKSMIDPSIFDTLQAKIDEECEVRESIKNILEVLEKHGK
jgi:hypothetical protein